MTRRTIGSVLAALAAAGLVGACSSESSSPPEPSTSTTEAPGGHGSFAECLAAHDVPTPPGPVAGPPPGVDAQTWQDAMANCSTLAPGPAEGS